MEKFYYICDFLNTAVQIWFVLQLADGLFEAKAAGKRLFIGQAALIGAVAVFKCGNDVLYKVLFSNGMLIAMAFLVAAGGKLLYEARWVDAICLHLWGFTLLALMDFFVQTAVYQVLKEQGRQTDVLLSFGGWRGGYLLVSVLPLLLVGRKVRDWLIKWRKRVHQYRKQGIILLVPMIVCFVYFQKIYIYKGSEDLLDHWGSFILGIILLLVLFWIYTVKRGIDEENRTQQVKIAMLERNYLALRQIYDEKELLLHDMKNHMYTFRDILSKGGVSEASEYVEEILGELKKSANLIQTRHVMLDLILNRKIQEAEEMGIPVQCEYDDMSGLELTTMELCALFANLLDNAIEANKRCPEEIERRLDVECRRREKMLIVTVRNRMRVDAAEKGVRILDKTEKDRRGHGYGMKSIRKVVDSYGGSMNADIEGNLFQIKVSLAGFANSDAIDCSGNRYRLRPKTDRLRPSE